MWLVREKEREEEMKRKQREEELKQRTERELGGREIPKPLREKYRKLLHKP